MFTTIVVPTEEKVIYCVVIHDNSLTRIRNADPAVLQGTHMANMLGALPGQAMPFERFDVMICYEPNETAFQAKCAEMGSPEAVFHYLTRNWTDDPADGDEVIPIRIPRKQPV